MILVSSDHGFLDQLHDHMGFNTENLNEFIYMREIAPNDMLKLLISEWGMKANLALALVDAFGGDPTH